MEGLCNWRVRGMLEEIGELATKMKKACLEHFFTYGRQKICGHNNLITVSITSY